MQSAKRGVEAAILAVAMVLGALLLLFAVYRFEWRWPHAFVVVTAVSAMFLVAFVLGVKLVRPSWRLQAQLLGALSAYALVGAALFPVFAFFPRQPGVSTGGYVLAFIFSVLAWPWALLRRLLCAAADLGCFN